MTLLRVLSINGERDGIFPPAIISEKQHELPSNAHLVLIPGMNHVQIGNYGPQSGDNEPTISDAEAREALVEAVKAFFAEH